MKTAAGGDVSARSQSARLAPPQLQKSIPTLIRQLIPYVGNRKGYVDVFVRDSIFEKGLYRHFLGDETPKCRQEETSVRAAKASDSHRLKAEKLKQGTP